MSAFYARITAVSADGSTSTVAKGKRRRKKRVTRGLRPLEKVTHQWLKGESQCSRTTVKRYTKSRRKKNDRWLTDFPDIMVRAHVKAVRKALTF